MSKCCNQRGFTLVEVVISLTIILMVIVPLGQMLIQGRGQAAANLINIQAVNLAQGIMETVKAKKYSQVNSTGWQEISAPPPGGKWLYRITVECGSYNLKTVTVYLRYPVNGRQKEISFTMLKGLR
ncbi:MAG: type II secretion system protein [Desulfotomaculum sp.]|nr:type II secretion system protein [Desulfotomaculum sp.]